jgi:spermidine/putrescine transport system ATP-binding protein
VLLLDEPLGALDLKLRRQMQLELKRIQHELRITFVHVTHDQEEAMTMADQIAIMNGGHIEQLGGPADLYEKPATAFVAGFLGASNLLHGEICGPDAVRVADGTVLRVEPAALNGRSSGRVAVGVRPEKLRLDAAGVNVLHGTVSETSYVGVSTQYIVDTPAATLVVYVQNAAPGAGTLAPGSAVVLSYDPEVAFIVEPVEEAAR